MGAQVVKITGIDDAGNPVGIRSDGARVMVGSADAENHAPRLKNRTPTLVHMMYFAGALSAPTSSGIDLNADARIGAAEHLQNDFYEGGLEPKTGMALEKMEKGNHFETPKQAGYRKLWNVAVEAVGPRFRNDVIMAVNFDTHAGSLDFLLRGLDRLAKHYGRK